MARCEHNRIRDEPAPTRPQQPHLRHAPLRPGQYTGTYNSTYTGRPKEGGGAAEAEVRKVGGGAADSSAAAKQHWLPGASEGELHSNPNMVHPNHGPNPGEELCSIRLSTRAGSTPLHPNPSITSLTVVIAQPYATHPRLTSPCPNPLVFLSNPLPVNPQSTPFCHAFLKSVPIARGKKVILCAVDEEPSLNGKVAEIMVGEGMPAANDPT